MSNSRQAVLTKVNYNIFMNIEDRKYLKMLSKRRPGLEVFEGMVQILKKLQEKTDELMDKLNNTLLQASKRSN